ncbi:MAG: hypothetical protein PHQ12_11915 [Chthoniobacteraceae bacterium]|nr:hypothetical protein [Chthoniobacteraceae bacterium]
MNDLPIINLLPEHYRGAALAMLALSPYVSRAYHALSVGQGLRGVISAIWLGTNTPKPKFPVGPVITTGPVGPVTTPGARLPGDESPEDYEK